MKNTIAERIFDFLKEFPPFNVLVRKQLLAICAQVKVGYYAKDSFIFMKDEELKDAFYVVKDGAVGLFRGTALVDKCDEGDIFGLRALIRRSNYQLSAKTIEESIVYAISSDLIEEIITSNTNANKFLLASFATNTPSPYSDANTGRLYSSEGEFKESAENITLLQSVQIRKSPITCAEWESIETAAKRMTDNRVGSIVIIDGKKPMGIITDKDLRTKIATGEIPTSAEVTRIMSSPVITVPENISIAEAQIAMLRHRITHLCITKDGTSQTETAWGISGA